MTQLLGMSNKTIKSDCENYGKKKNIYITFNFDFDFT